MAVLKSPNIDFGSATHPSSVAELSAVGSQSILILPINPLVDVLPIPYWADLIDSTDIQGTVGYPS